MNGWVHLECFLVAVFDVSILWSYLEHQWQKVIIFISVHIELNSSHDCQFWWGVHPAAVQDRFQKVPLDFVHLESQMGHLVFRRLDFLDVRSHQMFDAVHLVIEVTIFKVAADGGVILGSEICSDSCSTSPGRSCLTLSVEWAHFACVVYSDMRSKQNQNMTINWAMAAKSVPSGLPREWKSRQTSQREELSPSPLEKSSDIRFWVSMVDLIWASWISEKRVVICESVLFENPICQLIEPLACQSSWKMLIQRHLLGFVDFSHFYSGVHHFAVVAHCTFGGANSHVFFRF